MTIFPRLYLNSWMAFKEVISSAITKCAGGGMYPSTKTGEE